MKNKIFITAVLLLTFVSFMRAETGTGKVRNDRTANTAFTGKHFSADRDRIIQKRKSKAGKVMTARGLQNSLTNNDQGNTAYAVFDSTTGTLTFTYQQEKPTEGEVFVVGETEFVEPEVGESRYVPKWLGDFSYDSSNDAIYFSNSENIRKVVFNPSFADARPTSTGSWFYNCTNLTEIEGIEYLNTSEVTNMDRMFYNCSGLSVLDVSGFNTANVSDMICLFYGCSNLTTIDVSNFNTANVTDMGWMFLGCNSLESLDVSNFNTANVTDMTGIFCNCSTLTEIDVSDFNTKNVTNMSGMFDGCNSLEVLDVSNFNTANVMDMSWMFGECNSLTSLDLSNFNTANVMDMTGMFYGCSSLESLEINNFNTQNVTDMGAMFRDCSSLISLNVSNFNTENVTDMNCLFYNCCNLTEIDVSHFDTSNVTDMGWMFWGCNSLTSLDVSNFNTSKIWRMYSMFCNCESLTTLDVSNFDTGNVTEMPYMFHGCTNLTFIDVSNFNTENVTDMNCLFYECRNLTNIDVSHFNTSNVTDMGWLFYECNSLTSIDVSNFNTSKAWRMYSMFCGCNNLTALDVSSFDTGNVTEMPCMFYNCSSLTEIDVSHFNTTNVTDMRAMFRNCSSLTSLNVSNFNTENVTNMESLFHNCCNLTEIDVSHFDTSNVTDMGWMFWGCDSLTSLDVSNFNTSKVWRMYSMFCNCESLTTMDVSNFDIGNVTEMPYFFFNCSSLTSINLPTNMTFIDDFAFCGCKYLTNINILESITTVGEGAFVDCYGLTSITIPESVTSIGNNAFRDCSNLDSLILKSNTPSEIDHIVGDEAYSYLKVIVPVGTKEQYCETNGWSNFRYILEEGEEIEYVDGDVFRATTEEGIKVTYKIISIEDKTCQVGDGNYTAVNQWAWGDLIIPNNVNGFAVTAIGTEALSYCYDLKSITIPTNVTTIESPFNGCENLKTITVEDGNTVYDSRYDCNAIIETATNTLISGCMNTIIPNDVSTIGMNAFAQCYGLEEITIPSSVTSIGEYAFAYCYDLTTVTVENKVPATIADNSFYDHSQNRTLYVPVTSLDAYRSAAGWDVFDEYIEYGKDDLTIGESGQTTFCSDIDLDFSGIEGVNAYIATAVNLTAGTVMMTPVTQVPAGTGIYVVGNPGTYEIPYIKTSAYSMNLLKGNIVSSVINSKDGNKVNYCLTMDDNVGFTPILSAQTMSANSAYLQVPSSLVGNPEEAAKLTIVFTEEATMVTAQEKATLKLSDLSYTLPSEKSVYNGSEFYATVNNTADIGTVHIYYTDAYGNKTEQRPIATGRYTISFEIEESDLYNAITFPNVLTFTIKKQLSLNDLQYTVPDEEIAYDGNEHYATISNTNNFGTIYIYYTDSKGNKTTKRPVYPETYSISFEIVESNQYYANSLSAGEFTIKLILATEEFNMLKAAYEQMENTDKWYNKWTFNEEDPTKSVLPGVTVKDEHITAINLGRNNLSGNFPTALLSLPYLTTLNLFSNSNLTGDLGQQMTAYMEQNPDATFALKELNINDCGFSGNIGEFAQPLTNLTLLWANYNHIEEVYPMISSKVNSLGLAHQSIQRVVELNLKQLTPEVFTEKMPSIILYNHQAQSYEPSRLYLYYTTTYDNWSMTMRYQNGQLTIPSPSSQYTYYGTSGDVLNVLAYSGDLTLAAQNSTFRIALSFEAGDSNFDGDVNILDLQTVLNYMFETYKSKAFNFNFTASNLWQDDIINVQDVVKLVTLILNTDVDDEDMSDGVRATEASATEAAEATVYCRDGQLIVNTDKPVATFDITLHSSATVKVLKSLEQAGFTCVVRNDNGKTRLIGYSLKGATLPIGETVIAQTTGSAKVSRSVMADSQAQRIIVALDNQTTGIAPVGRESSTERYRLPVGRNGSIVIDSNGNKTFQKKQNQ